MGKRQAGRQGSEACLLTGVSGLAVESKVPLDREVLVYELLEAAGWDR